MMKIPQQIGKFGGSSAPGAVSTPPSPRPAGASASIADAPDVEQIGGETEPPNYREGGCESCANYDYSEDGEQSICTKYGGYAVNPNGSCDSWEMFGSEESPDTAEEV